MKKPKQSKCQIKIHPGAIDYKPLESIIFRSP